MKILILVVALFMGFSCSKKISNQIEIKRDLASTVIMKTGISDKYYPHTKQFIFSKEHGKTYFKDPSYCKACHGEDLLGGTVKSSCKTCHDNFPHKKDFINGHGLQYMKSPKSCNNCHYYEDNSSKKLVCLECHNYPHPKGWSKGQGHGQAYVKESNSENIKINCKFCHSKDSKFSKENSIEDLDCGACHVSVPHSETFKIGRHAKYARSYQGKCYNCHTDGKKYMKGEILGKKIESCFDCHGPNLELKAEWKKKNKK